MSVSDLDEARRNRETARRRTLLNDAWDEVLAAVGAVDDRHDARTVEDATMIATGAVGAALTDLLLNVAMEADDYSPGPDGPGRARDLLRHVVDGAIEGATTAVLVALAAEAAVDPETINPTDADD